MKLNFTYDLSARRVLHDREIYSRFEKMKHAGVETIYIFGYFYGSFESPPDDIAAAKKVLEDSGFNVGVINLPLGHGGNALDPNDPNIDLSIGNGWKMTMDSKGFYRANTTCIDDIMIEDTAKANRILFDIGFRRFMNDDDLRLGSWGPALQGCFCDRCMSEFEAFFGKNITRDEIVSERDHELSEAWKNYQCQKILRFLLETTPNGAENGIMVMHNGDRRHGIDIPLLRRSMPDNLIFRVGEGHFNDSSFSADGRDSLERSIRRHIALVGNSDLCYSETTVFPAEELSPENWIEKMRIEINCGLRNLYLMSGTWFFSDRYWDALEKSLPELRELAENTPQPELLMPEFSWIW